MKNLISTFLLFVVIGSYGQTNTKNYVKETTRTFASTSNIIGWGNENFVTVTYYDGLGRPVQIVDQNASPIDNKNIVTHIEYEKNIGQTKEYLPFTTDGGANNGFSSTYHSNFVDNTKNLTHTFYQNYNGNNPNPYSEVIKEASPRQRPLENGFPGTDWMIKSNEYNSVQPQDNRNSIRTSYDFNNFNEVKRFSVTTVHNSGVYKNNIVEIGYYPINSLQKTIVKNENWKANDGVNNTIEEFKDSQGNVVLKRTYNNSEPHDTYYAYNDLGLLAFVIPPLANGIISSDNLEELCYQYNYDARNRLVEKKLPQKEWEYIVYDNLNRVVMTGPVYNPFGTGAKGWLITKYDTFGRVAYTGYYDGTVVSSSARSSLAQNTFSVVTKQTSNVTIDGLVVRYNNVGFPTNFKILSVNYYDNYSFPDGPTSFSSIEGITPNTAVKGQLTGSWVRNLNIGSGTSGSLSCNLYDSKYRVISSYSQNHLGGYTQINNKLSFTGVPQKTVTYQKQNSSSTVLTITDNFTYDLRDRLTTHTSQINGGTIETIFQNIYDELGVLVNKKVGNILTKPLQNISYKYNIRGWLTAINNLSSIFFVEESQLFNYQINYNSTFNGDTSKPQYNGNISSIAWRTLNDNVKRGYGYDYDNLNRLNYASHLIDRSNLSGGFFLFENYNRDGQYAEDVTYDKNGNITSLKRFGEEDLGQPIEMDDLIYSYNGNQLLSVTDATINEDGFKDGNKVGNDYTYDTMGNIIQDKNKKITNITYNHLNLPVEVTFNTGKIKYFYDAVGTRLRKVVQPNSGLVVTTDYLSGFDYENGILQTFPHAEGYVKNNAGVYVYHYIYKDHLGNNRLVYADLNKDGTINPATEIVEENNYYPFGLKHKGYNELSGNGYKYKYAGKEWNSELGLDLYDFGARNYDPALGRWLNVDPLAEDPKQVQTSPYAYVVNNPINLMDPTGMIWVRPEDKERLQNDIKSKIKSHEGQIANLTESLNNETKEKRINSINEQINDFNERISLLNQSLNDVEMLDQDSRNYYLEDLPESATNSFVHADGNKIYIQGSNTGEHLHEVRHVGQFLENGRQLSAIPKNGYNRLKNAGKTLEQATFNEVEAYRIQAAYSGNSSVGMQNVNFIKDIDAAKINRNKRHSDGKAMYKFIEDYLKGQKK